MLLLHHLENSRSQRIAWALELLGLEYEVKTYLRTPEQMAPETLKRIHPLGHAPILEDDDVIIAESGAILEYLADEYDPNQKLKPLNKLERRDYQYWLHFAEGSFMPLLVMTLLFRKIPKQPMPFFVRPIAKAISGKVISGFIEPRLRDALNLIEDHLSEKHWFAGEHLSGADMQMSFPLLALTSTLALYDYPHIERWLSSVTKDPAYQRAVAKVGEFQSF
ncbi:Glutathione S-transferase GST-6.0 [Marinomonas aquimarina]|uniref:Glutathione S-transferase GST-6.0 n=1 Tax=Marinomonas aquimarina TaxID=295068 RepID=A0A1A8TGE4_9GAMM|nr:glutathione S-transferase [Marinomonas aquimarina]SBS32218.1 Glutathione S-transferase GST-6.0 [Marinomonas aquimarina]